MREHPSTYQLFSELPLSPDKPTSSFQSYGNLSLSRDLFIGSFQSYSSPVMSCNSHPSSTAVASCPLPTTSPVITSSAQLDLANTSLVTGGSTPLHIPTSTNSLTQNSPPLPSPVLSFRNATGTQTSVSSHQDQRQALLELLLSLAGHQQHPPAPPQLMLVLSCTRV